jgi:hypothetical protein
MASKEKRTMLYFKENGHFKFEKMEVEDTFLIERKNGRVIRAWEMLYKLMLPFQGYKNIHRDEVSLAYARDVIFDPFNILEPAERPTGHISKTSNLIGMGAWLADVTRAQEYKRQEESSKHMSIQTQLILLAIPTCLLGLGTFLIILVNLRN